MYQIIYLGKSADEAYKPLVAFKPFVPFRDASCGVSSFHLTVLDCLKVTETLARKTITLNLTLSGVWVSVISCRAFKRLATWDLSTGIQGAPPGALRSTSITSRQVGLVLPSLHCSNLFTPSRLHEDMEINVPMHSVSHAGCERRPQLGLAWEATGLQWPSSTQ